MIARGAWSALFLAFFLTATITAGFTAEKASQPAQKGKTSGPVKITGTVVAAGKDAKGNVNVVAIKTDKEQYRVVLKDKGKDLLKMLNKKVEASGTVKESKGKKRIHVSEYREAGK